MANNERERVVKRLKEDLLFAHETAKKHGGTAYRSMFSVSDLRLLLSERAELLATVERMRGGLEKITTNYGPGHLAHQIARAALTTGEEK
jgi:hypothetical protein